MLYIGLTGNIASGKSEVTDKLAELGATIIDADVLAREAVERGTPALKKIVETWGEGVLTEEGHLDRGALRKIVFKEKAELDRLNGIVHPEVARIRDLRMSEAESRGDSIVIYSVPLLFEAGMSDDFDLIVLIDAPRSAQLDRLTGKRGLDAEEARRMIDSQMSVEEKRPRSDFIVKNDGTLPDLYHRTELLWDKLTKIEKSGIKPRLPGDSSRRVEIVQ